MKWKKYSEKFYENPEEILRKENDFLAGLIDELKPAGKKCLDFGCGQGYWSIVICDLGGRVSGVDVCQTAIEQCKKEIHKIDFIQLKEKVVPFLDDEFNIFLISWMLQEVEGDDDFLRIFSEVERVLSSGGQLIIAENVYPDSRRLIRSSTLGDIFANQNGNPVELRFFPGNTVENIVKNRGMGFDLERRHLVGHTFFETYRKR